MSLILYFLFIVASVLDCVSTARALRVGGREANPVFAWLFRRIGFGTSVALKMLLAICIGARFAQKDATWWLLAINIVMAAVVVNNELVRRRLSRKTTA